MDITVALGGGGVKGYTHVGVLRALVRNGFRVRAIAGTSAGGLIGGLYAAGFDPDLIEERLLRMDQSKLYSRVPGDGPSLLGLGGVISLLQPWLTNITFDDLKIPFVATGVDLNTGQQVILNRGSLLEAILATIAVPGVFPPRVWEGHTLIDGGILDPVPVSLARFLAPNLPVVAVVLSPALSQWNSRATMPRLLNSMPLVNRFAQMRWAQSLSIFLRSIDMAGCLLTDLRLQIERPEVIIRPAVDPYGLVDKVDVPRIIRVGEEAVEAALPQIQRWVGSRLLQAPLPGNHPPRLPSA